MAIEIIPAGASAVVTERHHHEEHGSRHPDRWDLSTEMQRDLNQMRDRAESEFIELKNQLERNFGQVTKNQADSAREDAKSQSDYAANDAKNQADYAKDAALASAHSDEETQENFFSVQKQVSDAATSTVVGFKDAAATAYQVEGRSLLEAAKNAAALSIQGQRETDALAVQATANFNAVQVQAGLNQYTILLDSTKNAAASTLLATQIAATSAAAMAECCCEIKGKISSDGEKTRDLISANQMADLRDRANRSESALAAYFAAKVAPVVPVV